MGRPEYGNAWTACNPFSLQGRKTRLGTAVQIGLTFPDWMATQIDKVSTPFFVVHGSKDMITDPHMSQMLFDKACATDKKIELLEDAYHCELFCCLPGHAKMTGLKWLPEQEKLTNEVLNKAAKWMHDRI